MRAAVCQSNLMVYFLRWHEPPFFLALLAQRVESDMPRADCPPLFSVALFSVRVALVFFVAPVLLLLMSWAEAAVR
jgi:hypothetical protein